MKYEIDIGKFIKMCGIDCLSMYLAINSYMSSVYNKTTYIRTSTLDRAFFEMVENIDRSKLSVDIFVQNPMFTSDCPADLVKPEYQGFFCDRMMFMDSKNFLQLLQLAGVKKFTLNLDVERETNDGTP